MHLDQADEGAYLHRTVAATAEQVRTLRHALTGWAQQTGLTPSQVDDLEVAVYEAMANVVRHAYRTGVVGTLELHATQHDDVVRISVFDYGRWRQPPVDPGLLHGRGLPLIHSLTADVDITSTEHGTTVDMSWPCEKKTQAKT